MVSLGDFLVRSSILVISGSYTAAWMHETCHWMIGRVQSPDVEIEYFWRFVPHLVRFHQKEDFTDSGIRLAAIAPNVILLPLAVTFLLSMGGTGVDIWLRSGTIRSLLWSSVFVGLLGGGIVISPADLIGVFCVEKFRNWKDEGLEELSHLGIARELIRCIRE